MLILLGLFRSRSPPVFYEISSLLLSQARHLFVTLKIPKINNLNKQRFILGQDFRGLDPRPLGPLLFGLWQHSTSWPEHTTGKIVCSSWQLGSKEMERKGLTSHCPLPILSIDWQLCGRLTASVPWTRRSHFRSEHQHLPSWVLGLRFYLYHV